MAAQVDWYGERYAKLHTMAGKDGLSWAFGNGVSTHNKPLVSRQPREVLPNVYSFDPRFRDFVRKLSYELNDALPVDLDADKFTRTGIHTNFDRLRTVAGYMMNPMSYTILDNASYRDFLGLRRGYTPVQREIAKNVWRIIFSQYRGAPVKVAKKSTSGPRRNTSDHVWKVDFAIWVYESGNFERVLDCVDKNDWLTLADEFETLYMMYIQKRDQVDTPGKPRQVFDLDYALSNGARGKEFDADKKVVIEGQEWADFSATRARVVHAGPWVINCILSIISTGTMAAMFDRFPNVFHINTPEQIEALVNGNYVYCGDVKEYDRSMDRDAIEVPHEVAEEFWDPRMIKSSRLLYFSPYYARPLDMNGTRGVWVGDPRKMQEQVVAGNRSGHAWTSMIAKGNKFIETLFIFHEMGLKVVGNELQFLEGRGPINVINNGDDEVIYTPNADLMARFKKIRGDASKGHYIVSQEDGAVYSGMMLMLVDPILLTYKATPRLHTGFEKLYCPERSIGGNFRPYWYIGVLERLNKRDVHPKGTVAWEIHDRLFHDMLAPHFGTLHSMIVNAEQETPLDYDALNQADREVLEDPDKIHYKYSDDEVSDVIMDKIVTRIPVEKFEHILNNYYSGTIR